MKQLSEMKILVRAMTRDGVKAASVLPGIEDGVEIVEGDVFKYEDVSKIVKGCDVLIIATGPTDRWDITAPFKVDFQGVENLVAVAKQNGIKKIVMVSSIGADDPLFPLNLYGGVLIMKKFGELAIQRSGIQYTIIRPGGLLNKEKDNKTRGVVVGSADAFGLPPRKRPGSILRSKVAEACVAALVEDSAANKVIEVIEEDGAMQRPWSQLFESIE